MTDGPNSFTFTSAPTAAELEAIARQGQELERAQNGGAPRQNGFKADFLIPTESLQWNADGSVTKLPGSASISDTAVYADPGLRPGHVMVNGVETTVEAAIASGLMTRDEAERQSGFNQPSQQREDALSETGKGVEGETDSDGKEINAEEARAAQAASEAIQALDSTIGADAVDDHLNAAVESGEMPDLDNLPEGVNADAVNSIVSGYTAQANNTLREVGASVDTLMSVLDDNELREARSATISGDKGRLQELGKEAVARLANLPRRNPAAFNALIETLSPEERNVLRQTPDGQWIVAVPGQPVMSFGTAVREGIVHF